MRIHRLEVAAIGPFAERVVVDVDALSAGGLFLVHGPTGSGKTSLLDAVCFALYGDVPGARSRHALRSDHAGPAAVPEVVLELTVGTRRLRLTRSPEWQRPKRRGTGLTRVQPSVVLEERRGADWVTLSARHDEVADVVKDVLGMGLAQFAKVVLLPQGEFAAFLRATPEDRREVLERLFDIGVFADVEAWLGDQRRTTAAALEHARAGLAADLTRVEDLLAGVATPSADDRDEVGSPPAASLADLPIGAVPARLAEVSCDLTDALTAAMADVDAATGAEQLAQSALVEAREVSSARRRGLEARVRAAALAADAEVHAERLEELAAAERAATVEGHLTAHDRAADDLARTEELLERRHGEATALGLVVGSAEAEALAARLHGLDAQADALSRRAEEARRLSRELAETQDRHATAERDRRALGRDLEVVDAEVEAAGGALARLASVAARVPELALRERSARDRLELLDAVEELRAERDALSPRLGSAREAVLEAQAVVLAHRQRRLDGMAAELAARLEDGGPCPVCGAPDHPRPAVAADPISPEVLEEAEGVLEEARAALGVVEARDAALTAAAEARAVGLGGATRTELETEAVVAAGALDRAREAATALETAEADLEAARGRAEVLRVEGVRVGATVEALDARLGELAEEAGRVRDALAEAVDAHADCPCGGADPERHRRAGTALDDLAHAEVDRDAAAQRLAAASADLDRALSSAGFTDATTARAAARPAEVLRDLREAVATHVRDVDACRAVLEEPAVAAALDGEPPDIAALEEHAAGARREVLAASTAQESLRRAEHALARLRPGIESACRDLGALDERHARIRELADAVAGTGGENTLRMRLTSFVLAARLEKVAALANERLRVMGAGRYLLEHTDDRAARGARSGLGLRVLDQWTGRTRDTASLSGGESFMASLALALGLADAVREEAGGLDLGTLFVDEGFGSLDDDSLEQVLSVLDGLREGGRAVGVVSHVADLRTRIPYQAVVHKSADGSTVEVRAGTHGISAA